VGSYAENEWLTHIQNNAFEKRMDDLMCFPDWLNLGAAGLTECAGGV